MVSSTHDTLHLDPMGSEGPFFLGLLLVIQLSLAISAFLLYFCPYEAVDFVHPTTPLKLAN